MDYALTVVRDMKQYTFFGLVCPKHLVQKPDYSVLVVHAGSCSSISTISDVTTASVATVIALRTVGVPRGASKDRRWHRRRKKKKGKAKLVHHVLVLLWLLLLPGVLLEGMCDGYECTDRIGFMNYYKGKCCFDCARFVVICCQYLIL